VDHHFDIVGDQSASYRFFACVCLSVHADKIFVRIFVYTLFRVLLPHVVLHFAVDHENGADSIEKKQMIKTLG
jgi:hypothetical protein